MPPPTCTKKLLSKPTAALHVDTSTPSSATVDSCADCCIICDGVQSRAGQIYVCPKPLGPCWLAPPFITSADCCAVCGGVWARATSTTSLHACSHRAPFSYALTAALCVMVSKSIDFTSADFCTVCYGVQIHLCQNHVCQSPNGLRTLATLRTSTDFCVVCDGVWARAISSTSPNACSHRPFFSYALTAALNVMVSKSIDFTSAD
mmetsp:Transcript_17819/g.62562  ORF Transcript_17819/g.62562 Transcript_17819/m.62562 type:complete len:205 (-) Transcript_17819:252-866(-)